MAAVQLVHGNNKQRNLLLSNLLSGKIKVFVSDISEAPLGLATFWKAAAKGLKARRTKIGCSLAPYDGEIFDYSFNFKLLFALCNNAHFRLFFVIAMHQLHGIIQCGQWQI